MKKRKVIVTAVSGTLLILLYFIIFGFSAQDAVQSGSLSQKISERCAELVNSLSGGKWSEAVVAGWAEYFEKPIRKLAHFGEYACMGVLLYLLWSQWIRTGKKLCGLVTAWVFLSAAGDEFHQLFVPGRYGCFADVLLDTCGGVCGMLFCMLVNRLYKRRGRRKREKMGRRADRRLSAML